MEYEPPLSVFSVINASAANVGRSTWLRAVGDLETSAAPP
jgi:hypothetical protein